MTDITAPKSKYESKAVRAVKAAAAAREKEAIKLDVVANTLGKEACETSGHKHDSLIVAVEIVAAKAAYLRRARKNDDPVFELPDSATLAELRIARNRRAVRRGAQVYLPRWNDLEVALPNALLRSNLFSAGSGHTDLRDKELNTQSDASIFYSGESLNSKDRQVYSGCLDYYREDRPLSIEADDFGSDDDTIQVSVYKFAEALGVTYSVNSHRSICKSMKRLSEASLRARVGHYDLSIPRMLSCVHFLPAIDCPGVLYVDYPDKALRGSDLIMFRVTEETAQLYGPTTWSRIPRAVLNLTGLSSWIGTYFCTHGGPRWLSLEGLQKKSGRVCRFNDFRSATVKALEKLKNDKIPDRARVASYSLSESEQYVFVVCDRWLKDKAGKPVTIVITPEPDKQKSLSEK